MRFIIHFLKLTLKIISIQNGRKRWRIFWCYTLLTINSFVFYKIKRRQGDEVQKENILGYRIFFKSYGELLNLFEEIFIKEIYRMKLDNSNLIFDCGSNIGLSILYFRMQYPSAHIIGFELNYDAFALAEQNLRINGITEVELHNVALGTHDGIASLKTTTSSSTSLNFSVLDSADYLQEKEVLLRRLSQYIIRPVSLLKLDIEGSEIQILNEIVNSNKIEFIENLVIEFHSKKHVTSQKSLISSLIDNDFEVRVVNDGHANQSGDSLFYATRLLPLDGIR